MKITLPFVLIAAILTNGCEPFSDGKKKSEVEERFSYAGNNHSWARDFIAVSNSTAGYCLLVDESYSPHAHSLIKLDEDFKPVWKQTFEFTHFSELTELPNGDILLSGASRVILVKADGSAYTEIETIDEEVTHAFVMDNALFFYGVNFLYKYDLSFTKVWENRLRYNERMTHDSKGSIFGIDYASDSIRQYSAQDGLLIKDILISDIGNVVPMEIQVDDSGNFIILGTTNYYGSSCEEDIGLLKISPSGQKLWDKYVGNPNAEDYSGSLIVNDNFYGICGASEEGNCGSTYTNSYAAKFDTTGSVMKEYSFGKVLTSDGLSSILESDGQYFVAGGTGEDLSAKATIFRLRNF